MNSGYIQMVDLRVEYASIKPEADQAISSVLESKSVHRTMFSGVVITDLYRIQKRRLRDYRELDQRIFQ